MMAHAAPHLRRSGEDLRVVLTLGVLAAVMLLTGLSSSASGQDVLPSAESLFERHVEAIGGREAIASHKNRVVYGEIEMGNGDMQVLIVSQGRPSKLHYIAQSPGRFTVIRAFDGTSAWGIEMNGEARLLDPDSDEARDLAFNAVFETDAAYKTQYTSMRTTEQTIFADTPVFAVDVQTSTGLSQRIFFDSEDGLLIGKPQIVGAGTSPTELVFN